MASNAGSIFGELKLMIDQYLANWRKAGETARTGSKAIKDDLDKANQEASKGVEQLSTKISGFGQRLTSVSSALGLLPGSLGNVAARVSSLGSVLTANAGQLASIASSMGLVGSGGTAAAGGVAALGSAMAVIGPVALAAAAALAGYGIAQAALNSSAVKAFEAAETTEAAFKTMLGSAQSAKDMLQELRDFGKSTPFDFPEVAQTARSLLNVGIAADDIKDELQTLGDVASGAQTDLTGLAMIYTQVINKGKADQMDLMQLANRGVPIFKALQESMNVSGAELADLVKDSKIGITEVAAAFALLTGEGGKYHDAMKNQQGLLAQLRSANADTWNEISVQIGEVITKNLDLKGVVSDTTTFFENVGPLIVDAFDMGSRMLAPFVELFRSLMNLVGEIAEPFGEMNDLMDDAMGDETSDMVKNLVVVLNPLIGGVKVLAELIGVIVARLKWIKDNAQAAADNVVAAVTPGVTADDLKAQREQEAQKKREHEQLIKDAKAAGKAKTKAQAEGESEAAADSAGGSGSGGGKSAGGKGGRSKGKNADDLAFENQLATLRAAGQKEQADKMEQIHKSEKALAEAASDEERAELSRQRDLALNAIEDRYKKERDEQAKRDGDEKKRESEREASKKKDEQDRIAAIDAETRINQLRNEGKDLEAELAEIRARYSRDVADATSQAERDSLGARAQTQEAQARQKDAERKQREADQLAKEQERDAKKAGKTSIADSTGGRTLAELARMKPKGETEQMQRTLAQLTLREAKGNNLNAYDARRRDRLRGDLGGDVRLVDAAAAAGMQGNFAQANQSALGRIAQARGGASSTMGASGGAVNVQANISTDQLATAVVAKAVPVFNAIAVKAAEQAVEQLGQRLRAEQLSRRVKGGL